MLCFDRLESIKQNHPIVHCVSNIVSANDCANLALAIGAGPIMAQAPEEMAEITAISAATVLNTGTPHEAKFEACLICGKTADQLGRPVVLDPVGVGASVWRLKRTEMLLKAFRPTIIRANLGEAQALLGCDSLARGVDSPGNTELENRLRCAKRLAEKYRTTVLLSGTEDIVTNGTSTYHVTGGSALMSRVTGTGCMLSTLCGVFSAVEPDALSAAVLSTVFWKCCARRAEETAGLERLGSFRTELFNAAALLTAQEAARYSQSHVLQK